MKAHLDLADAFKPQLLFILPVRANMCTMLRDLRGSLASSGFYELELISTLPTISLLSTYDRDQRFPLPSAMMTLLRSNLTLHPLRRLQPAIFTLHRRLACTQGTPQKQCPSKAAASLSLSSTQFWSSIPVWKRAGINTLRCLVGCTVGDFSAMWYLQSFHADLGLTTIMALSSIIN